MPDSIIMNKSAKNLYTYSYQNLTRKVSPMLLYFSLKSEPHIMSKILFKTFWSIVFYTSIFLSDFLLAEELRFIIFIDFIFFCSFWMATIVDSRSSIIFKSDILLIYFIFFSFSNWSISSYLKSRRSNDIFFYIFIFIKKIL